MNVSLTVFVVKVVPDFSRPSLSRVSVLRRETAELQEEIKRQKLSNEQRTWIPGTTDPLLGSVTQNKVSYVLNIENVPFTVGVSTVSCLYGDKSINISVII